MPADKAVTIVREKLKEFGVCVDSDILAATTDGVYVMKKIWKSHFTNPSIVLATCYPLSSL